MATDQFDWSPLVAGVQTVVVRHDLLSFRVGKYLIAAQIVAVSHAKVLAGFPAHRIQTIPRRHVANLKIYYVRVLLIIISELLTSPR